MRGELLLDEVSRLLAAMGGLDAGHFSRGGAAGEQTGPS